MFRTTPARLPSPSQSAGYCSTTSPNAFAIAPAYWSAPRAPPCMTIVPCGRSAMRSKIVDGAGQSRDPQTSTRSALIERSIQVLIALLAWLLRLRPCVFVRARPLVQYNKHHDNHEKLSEQAQQDTPADQGSARLRGRSSVPQRGRQ